MIQKSKTILNEAAIKYYSIIGAFNIKILNRGFRHTDGTSMFWDVLCSSSHGFMGLFGIFME